VPRLCSRASPLAFDLGSLAHKLDTSLEVFPMVTEEVFRIEASEASLPNHKYYSWNTDEVRHHKAAIIQHSSGSSGVPKAISFLHKDVLARIALTPVPSATVCPLYHALALRTGINAIIQGQMYYFANPHVPLTSESMMEYLQATKAMIFWAGMVRKF
jgi:acyl-CoA synthetase (AMP-forming)/AMP-acid ligase II